MIRLRRTGRSGFTLVELMVVVAIIAILAAVAIPVYLNYVKKSKASEAFSLLQGIREKQEAYFAEFKRFTEDITWTPYNPGTAQNAGVCSTTHVWDLDPGDANEARWIQLGFHPDGPTYYTYSVQTAFQGGVLLTGFPATPGTNWPATGLEPWYVVQAEGDVDCNNESARFYVSSRNKDVIKTDTSDNINDDVF
jgi:prepilin-type N-terminal cleavage/methylation domain-containing protein